MPDDDAPKAVIPRTEHVVDFYGEPITVALVSDTPFVALRTFTDYLGLDWSSQRQRTERDEVLSGEVRSIVMTGADGKQREMLCLPLEFLPGWLFGVSSSRIRAELRDKIMRYRRHCFQVLWREVQADLLQSRVLVSSAGPRAVEISEQIDNMAGTLNLLREHLLSLLTLPEQVEGLSLQLGQAIAMLDALTERQETTETQVAQIDARTQRLTPAHARTMQDMVDRMVRETGHQPAPLVHYVIYGRLKRRFRVSTYKEIADDRFEEVMGYLREELRRATGGEAPEQGSLF